MINILLTLDLQYLMAGVLVILSGSIWFMKLLMSSAPELEALAIFEGRDRFRFKSAPFKQRRLCRKPITRICEDFIIEFYSRNAEKNKKCTLHRLSGRDTSVEVEAEKGQPIQIRFKYKDGIFWTGWSDKIPVSISQVPFPLNIFEGDQGIQMQPNNGQEEPKNEREFLAQEIKKLRDFINNSEDIVVRFVGPIGIGKSSLFNTLFCAWREEWKQIATSYSGNESITRKVDKHELISGKVWLADMPGFQNDSCFDLIPELIEGFHDKNEKLDMKKQPPQTKEALEEWKKKLETRQKTVVILVLDPRDMEEGDTVCRKLIKALIDGGYACLAVVTKVDTGRVRGTNESAIDENNFDSDPRVIDCCRKLATLGVNTVIPIINYLGNNTKLHDKINYVALEILKKVIDLAKPLG